MVDREKVIKGLECCSSSEWRCPLECPYYGKSHEIACRKLLEKDALELLKEQELIKPEVLGDIWICGNCKTRLERQAMISPNVLISENFNYCPSCGRKVKWDAET